MWKTRVTGEYSEQVEQDYPGNQNDLVNKAREKKMLKIFYFNAPLRLFQFRRVELQNNGQNFQ